jgi:glycosyltransferase involved in cell wall biosynthesis
MRRLLVNDALNQLGEHTFWNDLVEWFGMEFVGGDYATLADAAYRYAVYKVADEPTSLIVRNATWFPPIKSDVPTISLLQDIIPDGEMRKMQEAVIKSSAAVVFNSEFTASKYVPLVNRGNGTIIIPLPVDFSLFTPQNAMGCQQALSLPDGCVIWVGASQGAAGQVKGFDIFLRIVRTNPDIPFVGVFKDAAPDSVPPNLRVYTRLSHGDLVKVIGACRVGLCTSRTESQHLAGIEMGACGLPMVAPPVGVYWQRDPMEFPGLVVKDGAYAGAIRSLLLKGHSLDAIRDYWRKEFDKPVIKAAWTKLIEEVECSGRS